MNDFDFTSLDDCKEWTLKLIENLRLEVANSGHVETGALLFGKLSSAGAAARYPAVIGLSPTTSLNNADERDIFGAAIRRAIHAFDAVGVLTVGEFLMSQEGKSVRCILCSLEHKSGSVLYTLPYVPAVDGGLVLGPTQEERVLVGAGRLAGFFREAMQA